MKSAVAAVQRAFRATGGQKKFPAEIPILVRIWREDGVWNVSAFDLPIVVFDEDLERARQYFGEAACSHFMALMDLGMAEKTANELVKIAKRRGFYERRIRPRELVERIEYSLDDLAICAAVG